MKKSPSDPWELCSETTRAGIPCTSAIVPGLTTCAGHRARAMVQEFRIKRRDGIPGKPESDPIRITVKKLRTAKQIVLLLEALVRVGTLTPSEMISLARVQLTAISEARNEAAARKSKAVDIEPVIETIQAQKSKPIAEAS